MSKTLQPAKDDDTKEIKEYWDINKIVSVFKRENGDISICVELNEESRETRDLKLVNITISPKRMIGGTYAIERRGAPSDECLSSDTIELVLPGARTVGLIPFEQVVNRCLQAQWADRTGVHTDAVIAAVCVHE